MLEIDHEFMNKWNSYGIVCLKCY